MVRTKRTWGVLRRDLAQDDPPVAVDGLGATAQPVGLRASELFLAFLAHELATGLRGVDAEVTTFGYVPRSRSAWLARAHERYAVWPHPSLDGEPLHGDAESLLVAPAATDWTFVLARTDAARRRAEDVFGDPREVWVGDQPGR